MFCQYFDSHKYSKRIYLQLNLKAQEEKKIQFSSKQSFRFYF